MTRKQTVKIDVEALLSKKNQISNESIKNALKKAEDEKKAIREAELLENISIIQRKTVEAVSILQKARKAEKKAKTYLTAIATAEQEFYKDADFEKYGKAIQIAKNLFDCYCNS